MSRMLNALKQIEAMSPHPPLPSLPAEAEAPPTEPPKEDLPEAESPKASPAETEPSETQSPPSISDKQASLVAETLDEVRDEMAMEDSLLEAEAAMVAEHLPVDTDNATAADAEDAEMDTAAASGTASELGGENRRAYEALGSEILSQLAPGRPAVLMFTSPRRGGDTTDILLSLAATLVERIDGEILLVDVDLHEPRLAGWLGIEAHRGLADVLQGVATWEEVIRPTDLPRVNLLPGVKFPSQGGGGPRRLNLGPLLGELSAGYRLVLLDAASLEYAEIAPISRWCQGTYLAVRLGRTRRGEAVEAERLVRGYGGQVSGCVVVG